MSILQLPGLGLPLDAMPKWRGTRNKSERFPHAIADFFSVDGVTRREQRMLDFINQITDKPQWWEKVRDEEILSRWRIEACGTAEQQRTSPDHLDAKCFDYCVRELQDKATYLSEHGAVHVLDTSATVVKADVEHDDALFLSLRNAIRTLEDVPDHRKDWHPGTHDLVLDLLHPSLFPLQYGKTRVLPEGTVPLQSCTAYAGLGVTCPRPALLDEQSDFNGMGGDAELKPWGSYQWLPSEVQLNANGATITSYINNLHPQSHGDLYRVLAQAVVKAVPLWNECLSWFHTRVRINIHDCSFEDFVPHGYPGYTEDEDGDDTIDDLDEDDDEQDQRNWDRTDHYHNWLRDHPDERRILQPSPSGDYVPFQQRLDEKRSRVDYNKYENLRYPRKSLQDDFPDGLQVVFKLANIHLTPDQPTYSGSNWHVEGALNEHICATALFYYDSENISDSYLEFQHNIDDEEMMTKPQQHEYEALEDLYGVKQEETTVQHLGHVLTRPGRWLAFPNVMQHRVARFGLQDPSKPGHRKILAMFLVDPHIKVISTANVPPQRRDWWAVQVRAIEPFTSLPVELFDQIIDVVDDFPISWEEACEAREALMAERGRISDEFNEKLAQSTFFFCEH
ncbi:hypothetical protein LTR56_004195 [Elasticomyces elasticus]|nr:hypothetical protein LTR56_004195 [Elasticomyces elasticus]KAK3655085.1 hypothetical protein LTR22_010394 [Elasticomyces elasticus]KAK4910880.1 hypothetical protein LTR49_020491 [Elasticomyces elasticus]KAK5750299.1 hypothetical protein LTS12_019637 [Elasticomyces elasticus]